MRAELGGKIDVLRLVEAADEVARFQHRAQHRCRILGVGAQIAVAKVMSREEWRAAGEIEHEIAARGRAIARRVEHEGLARGGAWRGKVVNGEFEGAKMAPGVADG